MALKKTLYLANPYGFSTQQREGPLQELVAALAVGAEPRVWEPFARQQPDLATGPSPARCEAYQIGQADRSTKTPCARPMGCVHGGQRRAPRTRA